MKTPFLIRGRWSAAVALGVLAFAATTELHAQGIPEPSFIFYGTVRNTADNNLRLHDGHLIWTNRMSNGRLVTINTSLGNFAGFSYVLEVPAETFFSGSVSSNALQLGPATNRFDWLPVLYDSGSVRRQLSFALPAQASFLASSRQRGRIERVDLTVGIPCADGDGNGLCDEWETRYFGAPSAGGDSGNDFDRDGLTNLQEYRVGSNPNDENSGLLFVHAEALSVSGMRVEWESAEGRSYGLYRSTNLLSVITTNLTVAPEVRLIATNLFATPPRNVFVDTNAQLPGPYFYRLRLE